MSDYILKLHVYSDDGIIIEEKYNRVYFIAHNRYLHIPSNTPLFTNSNNISEIRWSDWVEYFRKDLEWTFVILKGWFCILKIGMRVQNLENFDQTFLTYCTLYNMLLEIDGLDKFWIGIWGKFDKVEMVRENFPFAKDRLCNPQYYHNTDLSVNGRCNDAGSHKIINNEAIYMLQNTNYNSNIYHIIRFTREEFRRKLANHFNVKFNRD